MTGWLGLSFGWLGLRSVKGVTDRDGWMDGWMDGWIDGQIINIPILQEFDAFGRLVN